MTTEQRAEVNFRCARVVHIAMPPHEPDGYTSTSDSLAIGVSFTGHSEAVVADGSGRSTEMSFPPGTCGIGGLSPTTWLRVAEPGEAVEIYASPDALASVAEELRIDWSNRPEHLQPGRDPVIWSHASASEWRRWARWRLTSARPTASSTVYYCTSQSAISRPAAPGGCVDGWTSGVLRASRNTSRAPCRRRPV